MTTAPRRSTVPAGWNSGLFLLSAGWLGAGGSEFFSALMFTLGSVAVVAAGGTPTPAMVPVRRRYVGVMVFLLGLGVGALLPAPYRSLAVVACLSGLFFWAMAGNSGAGWAGAFPCLLWLLLFQLLVALVVVHLGLQQSGVAAGARLTAFVLRVFGWETTAEAATVLVFNEGQLLRFRCSTTAFGIPIVLPFLLSWILVAAIIPNAPRLRVLPAVFVAAAYMVLRFLVLVCADAQFPGFVSTLNDPVLDLATWVFLPVWMRFALRSPVVGGALTFSDPNPGTKRPMAGIPSLAGVGGLVLAWGLFGFDPGSLKSGRVLIDESHGEWEDTDVPFDSETFGMRSLYSYTEFRRVLERYYSVDTLSSGPIEEADLDACDVLILKTPSRAFLPSEQKHIREFVSSGGGVLMIGDHTNVLAMNAHLNQVATPLGLQFRGDHVFPPRGETGFVYRAPHALFRHPAVRDVDSFRTMDGCTVSCINAHGESVLFHPNLVAEPADYSTDNFFGQAVLDGEDVRGPQRLAAAVSFGEGRALALGDSTIFSNFTMYDPGRSELLLGTVSYLNRRNLLPRWHRTVTQLLGFLAMSMLIVWGLRTGPASRGALTAVMGSFFLGSALLGVAQRWSYATPSPRMPVFLAQVWEGRGIHEAENGPYRNLFMALARAKLVPAREEMLLASARPDFLVIVDPRRIPEAKEIKCVEKYVHHGGNLLVIDAGGQPNPSTQIILRRFGLWIESRRNDRQIARSRPGSPFTARVSVAPLVLLEIGNAWTYQDRYEPDPSSMPWSVPLLEVRGGTPLLFMDGIAVAVEKKVGRGKIIACTLGDSWSDAALGEPLTTIPPESFVKRHHEPLFELLRALQEKEPPPSGSDR